jgi:predicted transposase/invertase (TIGR01784 family)
MILFEEHDDPLDIRYDNVFKAVFARDTPASKGALSNLVSALIGRTVSILTITANEPPIENTGERSIRFDLNCKAEGGELVNVEMSFNPLVFEPLRLEYYSGKLFTSQDIHGKNKSYKDLQETYQIAILANRQYYADNALVHTFQYYDPEHGVSLGGKTRIITLELTKAELFAGKAADTMSLTERWCMYFQYLTDKTKRKTINKIVQIEEGIAMATEVLMTISRDERERAYQLSRFKYEMDMKDRMLTAEEEGRAAGMAEGRVAGMAEGRVAGMAEGAVEIARNLLSAGVPLDLICQSTGVDKATLQALLPSTP